MTDLVEFPDAIEWRGIKFERDEDRSVNVWLAAGWGAWAGIALEKGEWSANIGGVTVSGSAAVEALESVRSRIREMAVAVGLLPEKKQAEDLLFPVWDFVDRNAHAYKGGESASERLYQLAEIVGVEL